MGRFFLRSWGDEIHIAMRAPRFNNAPICRGRASGPQSIRGEARGWALVTPNARSDDVAAMSLLALPALRAVLTKDRRLIGIDPGSKTIGLALTDVRLMLASPFGSLKRGKLKKNAAEILAVARQENAGGLVVGLPLSMDGTAGPAAQAARDWALALSEATGLPAALFDERLSSAAANRFLIEEADVSRRKRAEAVDRLAAAWMLQAALDASRPKP
jgi:putative Holliday junction resolvase